MNRRLKIGHTAITWPEEEIAKAVETISRMGYCGTETFGWVLDKWEEKGGLAELLQKYQLPLSSTFAMSDIVNPHLAEEGTEKVVRWSKMARKCGCRHLVFSGSSLNRNGFSFSEHREYIVKSINKLAGAAADEGMIFCYHPHTGTPVETEEETRWVMEHADPACVFFAPDVGQIEKGGGNALRITKEFLPMVKVVHLKDFIGGKVASDPQGNEMDPTGYLSYTPLGKGVVDIAGVMDLLEASEFDGDVLVELDGTHYSKSWKGPVPAQPYEKVLEISKKYLHGLGYDFPL